MKTRLYIICFAGAAVLALPACGQEKAAEHSAAIKLPPPTARGEMSVEEAIYSRKSLRRFKDRALPLSQVSQIMWAAGGKTIDAVTGPTRSYPSAGGIYPLVIYLVAGKVAGLSSGIYRYEWKTHRLDLLKKGDFRRRLSRAAWGQDFIARAPAAIVITAKIERTTARYGSRGEKRYVPMDVGHAGQNVCLQAEALGLGTAMVGAFNDKAVSELLELREESPFYILPFGAPVK